MNVKWYLSDLHACGHIRGEIIARVLNLDGVHRVDCKTQVMLSDYPYTDIMVFQRQTIPKVYERLLDAKKLGIPTVYDIDDNLFDIPTALPEIHSFYHRPEVQRMLRQFMMTTDVVVASTAYLARVIEKIVERPVEVVENGLDCDRWLRPRVLGTEKIVIGWMASGSHKMDAPLVCGPLSQIMHEHPEVEVTLIGWVGMEDMAELKPFSGRIKTLTWQGIDILPDLLADFSIGICPLQDNEFNRCKSGIKALQYWASSTPIVVSQSAAYCCVRSEETGLVAVSQGDWYRQLKRLVTDASLRKSLGAAGRTCLETEHSIRLRAKEWISKFSKVRELSCVA